MKLGKLLTHTNTESALSRLLARKADGGMGNLARLLAATAGDPETRPSAIDGTTPHGGIGKAAGLRTIAAR